MNLSQTKLVGLTMKLDLKAQEYKELCDELERLKTEGIDPNDNKLLGLRDRFQSNHNEIVEINKQIRSLKEEEAKELEQYGIEDLFKNMNKTSKKQVMESRQITVSENEKNTLFKLLEKIKQFFIKK